MILIIIFLQIFDVTAEVNCTNAYDVYCCNKDCPYCGPCKNRANIGLAVTFNDFENNCCIEAIKGNNRTCNETKKEPCIEEDNNMNDLKRLNRFFNTAPIGIIVAVALALTALFLFLVYVCCFFGEKGPSVKYKKIKIMDSRRL